MSKMIPILISFAFLLVVGNADRQLVEKTIEEVEQKLNFQSNKMLLRMALIESDFGDHKDTLNTNFIDHTGLHSIGIWQITKMCLDETRTNPNLVALRDQVKSVFGIDWAAVTMDDLLQPVHNLLTAYLYMKFAELAWPTEAVAGYPTDLQAQAKKWKNHFNRNPGGLSIEGFIKKCNDNGLGE